MPGATQDEAWGPEDGIFNIFSGGLEADPEVTSHSSQ